MEKDNIFQKLNENVEEMDRIESEIAMIQLAIYQKNIAKLKDEKLKEIKEYFEQQAKQYHQKSIKFQQEIDENIEEYKNQMEKLINAYDTLYIDVFKIMQNAMNNQKIAIANIVTLKEKRNTEEISEEEENEIQNTIIACAQKKLNYAVIIEECKARIKWCIENVQNDINTAFYNNEQQMEIYKENILIKIRRFFERVSGKRNFKRFLENYKNENLKKLQKENTLKTVNVILTLKGIHKQMKQTKKEITKIYSQAINH